MAAFFAVLLAVMEERSAVTVVPMLAPSTKGNAISMVMLPVVVSATRSAVVALLD